MWFKTAANDSSSSRYIGVRDDALRRKDGGTKAEYYTVQWTIYSSLVLTDWCDVFVNNNVNTTNKVVWYAALPTTSQDCTRLLVSICMYSTFRACTLWGLVTMTFKLARPQNGGARCTFHEKPDHQIWTICLFVLELQALRCRRTDQRTAMEVTAW